MELAAESAESISGEQASTVHCSRFHANSRCLKGWRERAQGLMASCRAARKGAKTGKRLPKPQSACTPLDPFSEPNHRKYLK